MKAIDKFIMFQMAVSDMDKTKEFYADKLGFKITKDYGQGGQHWVSMDLPGGGPSISFTTFHENMKPGTMKLYLSTPDIEAAYEELTTKGVKSTSEIADDGWGKWFGISDPDGNQWLVVQS